MSRLVALENEKKIDLTEAASVIGRDSSLQARIQDRKISRRHAMIRRSDFRSWLYDLGSANGTFLNGRRVSQASELKNGDEISFGGVKFHFEAEDINTVIPDDYDLETFREVKRIRAVLFAADIKGYTTLSEEVGPDQLANLMGQWYSKCEEIFGDGGGSIQDFAGDSVFAYWRQATEETCHAALKAGRELLEFSHSLREGFGLGVGIHVGDVAAGSMQGTDYRVLGDPVNLTFRVESLTRSLGHNLLVTSDFLQAASIPKDSCENVGEHEVKGRVEKVKIFAPK